MENPTFTPQEIEIYMDALSDINCWLSGFLAAGGTYSPGTSEVLKDLRIALQREE